MGRKDKKTQSQDPQTPQAPNKADEPAPFEHNMAPATHTTQDAQAEQNSGWTRVSRGPKKRRGMPFLGGSSNKDRAAAKAQTTEAEAETSSSSTLDVKTPTSSSNNSSSNNICNHYHHNNTKNNNKHAPAKALPIRVASPNYAIPPNSTPRLTVEDIRKDQLRYLKDWQASECFRQMRAFVEARADDLPIISKAVCLGPGSFDPESGFYKRTAHIQVAAFVTLVSALTGLREEQMSPQLIIQEPALTEADKEFCREIGLEVAENNEAFGMIDEDTLVFGIHLYFGTWRDALHKLPAIYIGTGFRTWEDLASLNSDIEEYIRPIATMDATYHRDKFPSPDLEFTFTSTSIYWRDKNGPLLTGPSSEMELLASNNNKSSKNDREKPVELSDQESSEAGPTDV